MGGGNWTNLSSLRKLKFDPHYGFILEEVRVDTDAGRFMCNFTREAEGAESNGTAVAAALTEDTYYFVIEVRRKIIRDC